MRFVVYNGLVAAVVKTGIELSADGNDLDDHLGLWFGEKGINGDPIVYIIPAEYVESCPVLEPTYRH